MSPIALHPDFIEEIQRKESSHIEIGAEAPDSLMLALEGIPLFPRFGMIRIGNYPLYFGFWKYTLCQTGGRFPEKDLKFVSGIQKRPNHRDPKDKIPHSIW